MGLSLIPASLGRYSINFNGEESDEANGLVQKPYLIRHLTLEERAVCVIVHQILSILPIAAHSSSLQRPVCTHDQRL